MQTLEQVLEQAKKDFQKQLVFRTHVLPSQEHHRNVLFRKFSDVTTLGMASTKKTRHSTNKSVSTGNSARVIPGTNIPYPVRRNRETMQMVAWSLFHDYNWNTERIDNLFAVCGLSETWKRFASRMKNKNKAAKKMKNRQASAEYVSRNISALNANF